MGAAAVAVGTTLVGSEIQARGQQRAERGQRRASAANVLGLLEQGRLGSAEIERAGQRATEALGGLQQAAIDPLQPFAQTGRQGFETARSNILSGVQTSPFAESVSQAARESVMGRRGFNLSPVVQRGLDREARLTGQAFQPGVNQQLLETTGRAGIGAAGDIAGITARGGEFESDLARNIAAQRASALTGNAPLIQQQQQAAQDARLLGGVAAGQRNVDIINQLSGIAGREFGGR